LAWLTYMFVEHPLRFSKRKTPIVYILMLIMTVIAGIGFYTYKKDGLPSRDAVTKVKATNQDLKFDLERSRGWLCDEPPFKRLSYCYYEGKLPSVVIIGDSHAPRIYSGLKTYYD